MSAVRPASQADIRAALAPQPIDTDEWRWITGGEPQVERAVRAAMPADPVRAAVLVPLVCRRKGFSVLLTSRSADLRDHAGQVSFPGGRMEPGDSDPWDTALREAHEEIGLERDLVRFAGYLPVHPLLTGFRVTPAVGFVAPGYRLRLDEAEVREAFEVPLDYLFDAANFRERSRILGGIELRTTEILFEGRTIWGATCGMLMTLRRQLSTATGAPS